LLDGRLVVYDQAHLSTDQASFGSQPEAPSGTINIKRAKSYAEVTANELTTVPASTGLDDSLAKLTTNSSETSQGHAVSRNREETGRQLAAGTQRVIPRLVLKPPKETPAEKRKQKRKAAKAAKAAKITLAARALIFCTFLSSEKKQNAKQINFFKL